MEESDKLIISSLSRLGFEFTKQIDSLNAIDSETLINICIQFLKKLGWKFNLPQSNQKFRIATKVTEEIMKASGIRVDMNALMNPTVNDLRKIIVSVISKLTLSEEEEGKSKMTYETFEEKINMQKKDIRVQTLKSWIKDDWIHPALSEKNCNSYRTYETYFSLQGPSVRSNYIINPFEKQIKTNLFSSLVKTISYSIQQSKIEAAMKGKKQNEDQNQEIVQQHQQQLEDMKQKNKNEWLNIKKKKINKIVEQLKKQQAPQEEQQQIQQNIEIQQQQQQQQNQGNQEGENQQQVQQPVIVPKQDQNQTLYNLQMQFQEEQQDPQNEQQPQSVSQGKQQNKSPEKGKETAVQSEFDLESMRKKHQEEIDELSKNLEKNTNRVEKYQKNKKQLEELIQQRTEEIEILKDENIQLQKKTEQQHQLVKQFENKEGSKLLKNEIQGLENEINNIEKEWDTLKQQKIAIIDNIRSDVNQKRDKIELQKEKARRIDTDYQQLINDLRQGYDEQEQLIEEYKKMPKDSNRTIYVKRISEISSNYNKLKTDLNKIIKEVKELDDTINFQTSSLQRHQIEFENCYNTDPKKNDSINKNIFKLFQDYRDTMEKTINNLKDLSKKKIEQREYDIKLDLLQSKNYKNNIQKLQADLQEIKLENEKLEKMI